MNTYVIDEDTILKACRIVSRGLSPNRLLDRRDLFAEAYVELATRWGKPFWSAINWAQATLRRKHYGYRYVMCEADVHEDSVDESVFDPCSPDPGPLELNIVHELDERLRRHSEALGKRETYEILRDLDTEPAEKAERIGDGVARPTGHNRIRYFRQDLCRRLYFHDRALVPSQTYQRHSFRLPQASV